MAAVTMAIVVLVPGKPGKTLERLRRKIDPNAADAMEAHLPIVSPFRAEPSFLPLEQHCWRVGHEHAPFEVALGPLRIDDAGAVRAEIVSGASELRALREALVTGRYAPSDGSSFEPRAVVATLRPGDVDWARSHVEEIEIGAPFTVERFELMAQYPDGTWYQRDFYTLDQAVTTP